ncbi:MAG: hypothetical protein U0075_23570 [Thermomicrobiales bacterium]
MDAFRGRHALGAWSAAVDRARLLRLFEQLRIEHRLVHPRYPSVVAIRQFTQEEAVLQYPADGVLGEEVATTITRGTVARSIQHFGHLPVRLAIRGKLER